MSKQVFSSVFHAISFYRDCNPTRARSVNLLDPERKSKPSSPQFSGDHPHDRWAVVCLVISKTLKMYGTRGEMAFRWYYLDEPIPGEQRPSKRVIGMELRMSEKGVRKLLGDIVADIERALIIRELLEPEEAEQKAS